MVKTYKILILLPLLLLYGCNVTPAKKEIIQKEVVVVYEIPTPPKVVRPVLETSKITPQSSFGDKTKALEIALQQLLAYSTDLEVIVNKYNELSNEKINIMDVSKPTENGVMIDIDKLKAFLKEHKK